MTESDAVRHVMRAAVEYPLGLYEVLWGLRADYPEIPDSERAEVGRSAVRKLVNEGWIALYVQPWQPGKGVPDFFDPIPKESWESVLAAPETWDAPRFNTYVAIAPTDEGKKRFVAGLSLG